MKIVLVLSLKSIETIQAEGDLILIDKGRWQRTLSVVWKI